MIIPHSRPTIDQEDIDAVTKVLASGMIAQGEKVREFESAIAKFVGIKYGIAVSSGTAALHLALNSLDVGPGDEVIMPSYVCSSPYFAVSYTGASPVVVDINLEDLNICAKTAKEHVTSRTKAIIVPHMFGTPAEVDELGELGVSLIEDCAQSLGAEYKGRRAGSFGELSVFSFYATKMITSGEGGMVLTDNRRLYDRMVDSRIYDKKPLAPAKYNYKMTDFQAALGLSQLKKLKYFVERRIRLASEYNNYFSKCAVELLAQCSYKKSVYYRYIIMIDKKDYAQRLAKKRGIMCENPVFRPLHKSLKLSGCPNSDRAHDRALSIPLYPNLTEEEVEYLLQTLESVLVKRAR
jgi:dTDP-4-amino-4,6-dideoxygalactose transaminase